MLASGIAVGMLTVLAILALSLVAEHLRQTNRSLREGKRRIAESEARLALALDAGSDGLWDCDLATGAAWCSERWWRFLGYEPGEMEAHARTWRSLLHPEDAALTERVLADHLEGRAATYEVEHRMRRKDGTWAWLLTRGRVVDRAADGTPLRFVATQIDIGARKAAERQIAHMARHDGLTDLPNRALFYDRWRSAWPSCARAAGRRRCCASTSTGSRP